MTAFSNTRSADKNVRWGLTASGVDTLTLMYRGHTPAFGRMLDHLAVMAESGRMRYGRGGAVVASPECGAPVTIGWYPANGAVFVEGRMAPLLEGDRRDRRLWPVPDLPYTHEAGWELVRRHLDGPDVGTPDVCGVARIDLTSEVEFDGGGGFAFLAALGSLDVPRYKVDTWRHKGRTETVYLRTPKRGHVHLRAYDKGVESGEGEPGARVRLERQARFAKSGQVPPMAFSERHAGDLHAGGLRPLRDAAGSVHVAGPVAVVDRLTDLWREGVITRSQARRLAGYVMLASRSVPMTDTEERAERRQARELRDLGLAVSDWEVPGAVPVGDVLRVASEAFAPG